jgi:hypothetical protein
MSGGRLRLALFLVLITGLGGFGLGDAKGGPLMIYDTGIPKTLDPQPWTVTTFPTLNPGLTLTATPADGTARTTALALSYTFNNLTPITVVFTENAAATMSYGGATGSGKAGLNFSLTEMLTNATSKTITQFTETLTDSDMQKGKTLTGAQEQALYKANADDHHPPFSHFHGLSSPGPFNSTLTPAGDHYFTGVTLSGGKGLLDGQTTGQGGVPVISMATVHDVVIDTYQRQFTLTITPLSANPEPSTVILLVTGMVGVAGFHLVRKRREREVSAHAEPR